jgi:hypothetical protein
VDRAADADGGVGSGKNPLQAGAVDHEAAKMAMRLGGVVGDPGSGFGPVQEVGS